MAKKNKFMDVMLWCCVWKKKSLLTAELLVKNYITHDSKKFPPIGESQWANHTKKGLRLGVGGWTGLQKKIVNDVYLKV